MNEVTKASGPAGERAGWSLENPRPSPASSSQALAGDGLGFVCTFPVRPPAGPDHLDWHPYRTVSRLGLLTLCVCTGTVVSVDEAYGCHVQRFRRDVGIAVAREFARYRIMRVPLIGVPRAVVRDRHAGRREARAVPAEGPMQADFFRHQADIWQEAVG